VANASFPSRMTHAPSLQASVSENFTAAPKPDS
jgi:hypothetical protein